MSIEWLWNERWSNKIFKNHLKTICKNRPANFANGREMRNIFNATRDKQANRLANFEVLTDEQLIEFIPEDFPFWFMYLNKSSKY